MINSVNVPVQTILEDGIILYSVDRVRSKRGDACNGGWLFHDLGSGQFTIVNKTCTCQVFEIDVNMNITSATTGALAFAIQTNGESVGGTEMDYTVATANVYGNVSASTLITVPNGASVIVSVKNLTQAITIVKDANIIIKKVA